LINPWASSWFKNQDKGKNKGKDNMQEFYAKIEHVEKGIIRKNTGTKCKTAGVSVL
jgi:ribosomal protein S20